MERTLTDSGMRSCEFRAEIGILRRHKALIHLKMCYICKKWKGTNDVAIGALPVREPYFSLAGIPVFQF